jgi:gentisate 1,2-dioxygenase
MARTPEAIVKALPQLWAGMQILLPGETAPAHRHSPAAIRFIRP